MAISKLDDLFDFLPPLLLRLLTLLEFELSDNSIFDNRVFPLLIEIDSIIVFHQIIPSTSIRVTIQVQI
ncbi:hypothetical protein DERF_000549 [Dermatophagoides farinae]|uniref:Uncharacterized protein n=1 Tax=Dermatophagoides farinae TaxID=6954 RepID=A0A922LCI5_DERFA|nr:hypothetical protein DERF_000549 [Dermatophagoides farinae]